MLTKVQQTQLDELKRYKVLYVGYQAMSIMRVFDKLVVKGYATVSEKYPGYGKRYQIKES